MANRIEHAVAKTVGKVKEAKAGFQGLRGVFMQLASEHGEVTVLIKRCASTSDPAVRAKLFPEIRKQLLAHERAEMAELYTVLRNHEETASLANHHDREAQQMESMLAELSGIGFEGEAWAEKFAGLANTVEHHAEEEEKDIFPAAQKAIGNDLTHALEERYMVSKQAVLESL